MKAQERQFGLFQKGLDIVLILMCWWLAYLFRFEVQRGGQEGLGQLFMQLSLLLVLLTTWSFHHYGLYRSLRFSSRYKEILAVLRANTASFIGLVVILYFFAQTRLSRLTLIYFYLLSSFILILSRIMVRNLLRELRKRGKNLRHFLILGNSQQILAYLNGVRSFKDSGIRFHGWIDSDGLHEEAGIPKIAQSFDLIRKDYDIDGIVIGYKSSDVHKLESFLQKNYDELFPIHVLPELTYSFVGHQVEDFAGVPVLSLNQPNLNSFELALKRSFDLVASGLGLLIISPLLFFIAIGVKLTSRGPIFFAQERMGLDGDNFKMWKFRSMKVADSTQAQPGWTVENDPRRTAFGTFLRKTSLDELPQLWNVFIGDMSLVGPRPEQPFFVEKFRREIPGYMLRHKMRAGITGWAQVNGWRGDTSIAKRIECDNYYIKNWSLILDFKILFLTFWKGFINKNAY